MSITVDPLLLEAVDRFVSQTPGTDRSKVFDEAHWLWCAQQQQLAMEAQLAAPQDEIERAERLAWRAIQAAAAERRFWPVTDSA